MEYINVTFTIPLNSPRNKTTFSKEAIEQMCKDIPSTPIIVHEDCNKAISIGSIEDSAYIEDGIKCTGKLSCDQEVIKRYLNNG